MLCRNCHMVRGAASGARSLGLLDGSNQHYQGDIASHRFNVTRVDDMTGIAIGKWQPLAATYSCASACHPSFVPDT